ncbi:hypothetical protein LWP59_08640 [Amycolatopsis acidiphila]|nr:hypothetical protein [Amycolatopsis acidiphila]UIJ61673.1 hypothetical protein LWP59_08640 [Amycolatopsis acidiphila]
MATHATEADIAIQHIGKAREFGMDASGFLVTSHMAPAAELTERAKIMEDAGAHCVYVTDSGGRLTMRDVRDRVHAYRHVLEPTNQIGIHPHENLSLSVANSAVAVEEGVTRVDASLAGHGAGAGNCPIEAFVAVADIYGWKHGCDLFALQERPTTSCDRCKTDRWGWTAKPSRSASRASIPVSCANHGLDTREILVEVGRRGMVGGQEDMITDIALDLARKKVASRRIEPLAPHAMGPRES